MWVVKVVILNWNGERVLPRFLPSVVANTPSWADVVVVDNGSTDGSRELLARDFADVAQLHLDRNYGFAEGYNRALAMLEGDVFVLLNSDVETPAGWLEPLVETLMGREEIAVVGPKILSVSELNRFEYAGAAGGMLDLLGYPYCRGRVLGRTEFDRGQYDDRRRVFWVSGACMALKRSAWEKVGELDGDFFAHQEEMDWCWRAQSAGLDVVIEPRSAVFHLGGGTLKPSPSKSYLNFRNNLAMLYKNLPAGRMELTLAVRFVLDFVLALCCFVGGRRETSRAIVKAQRDFLRTVGVFRPKRRTIQAAKVAKPVGMRGFILFHYFY